jgi:hypothetical protein
MTMRLSVHRTGSKLFPGTIISPKALAEKVAGDPLRTLVGIRHQKAEREHEICEACCARSAERKVQVVAWLVIVLMQEYGSQLATVDSRVRRRVAGLKVCP